MIYEIALLKIHDGKNEEFEKKVAQALPLFQATKGFLSFSLENVIEERNQYFLRIGWQTLESHTVNFREGKNFIKWRAMVGDFFAEAPHVVHIESKKIF